MLEALLGPQEPTQEEKQKCRVKPQEIGFRAIKRQREQAKAWEKYKNAQKRQLKIAV